MILKCCRERGVALVITLIFLAVITVMAVAFLALTRRGRISEEESRNRTVAEQMSDTALERAKGEILARILTMDGDLLGPELMVSVNDTNFLYGDPIDGNNDLQDIASLTNLLEDPRVPVFFDSPPPGGPAGTREFRFYVDLNRNGVFETNGLTLILDDSGQVVLDDTGLPMVDFCVGDPEWIGSLPDPSSPHSKGNQFLGRYAFLIQPVGRTLDVNTIHNDAQQSVNFGFFRNQGFGPWEINLAAFLAELNTNVWDYRFPDLSSAQGGVGFADASELLNHRYMGDYRNLLSFEQLFPGAGLFAETDFIDAYANSFPALFGTGISEETDVANENWPGAPNLTNFYTLHDLIELDPQKPQIYSNFIDRLRFNASQGLSTYDRYTFYRMLNQLGTDSAPDHEEKVNVNYANVGQLMSTMETVSPTNFVAWTNPSFDFPGEVGLTGPEYFFNAAIDRVMRAEMRDPEYDFFWTNRTMSIWDQGGIPVVVNGLQIYTNKTGRVVKYFSPRVHQLCQVAANIYDATYHSKQGEDYPYLPTAFRPVYANDGVDLWIQGFVEVEGGRFRTELLNGTLASRLSPLSGYTSNTSPNALYYEIPIVIGARKGFPNLNEVVSQAAIGVSRKLEVLKDSPTSRTTIETNQMLIMGISNTIALEAWYPYTNGMPNNVYPRNLEMWASVSSTTTLTNNAGFSATTMIPTNHFFRIRGGTWGGMGTNQFWLPSMDSQVILPDSVYYVQPTPRFEPVSRTNQFEREVGVFTNIWGMTVSNRILYALFDVGTNRPPALVDFVTLNGLNIDFDVSRSLNQPGAGAGALANVWDVNPFRNVTLGVFNQLQIAMGNISTPSDWAAYGGFNSASGDTVNKAIASFRQFMGLPQDARYPTNDLPPLGTAHQVPFTPTRRLYHTTSWQVNDPLVHYTVEDLTGTGAQPQVDIRGPRDTVSLLTQFNLNQVNDNYKPWWGKNADLSTVPPRDNVNPAIKDPGLWNPDAFEFPTNKFPNIGWLGRVHRGTPWQTIYLKADVATDSEWLKPGGPGHDLEMHPTNDWRLVEWFSTALTPEMTRGRMSINQTNLAAWSAMLSGVSITTLDQDTDGNVYPVDQIIQPVVEDLINFPESRVKRIVDGIVATRSSRQDEQFTCVADILSVPELTTRSPFLEEPFVPTSAFNQRDKILRDVDYERIPQQILSLLKLGEARFVIYTFGQSLKPADAVRFGPNVGMPNNYRITSEVAARTVVRVEFDPLETDPSRPDYSRPHVVVEKFNLLPLY